VSNQQIRPSQFITTYGPGSILETRSGPVVAFSADRVFNDNGLTVQDYEVRDTRLARDPTINGSGIVRMPTNAEVSQPESFPLYPSDAFPYWCLCVEHRTLYTVRNGCPQCPPLATNRRAREKAGREAIRFVLACSQGHLDDVEWTYLVHNGGPCAGWPGWYRWLGGGGSLRSVQISCPRCGATANFGAAYGRDWRCSERLPERGGRPPQPTCAAPARIIQRGAANLRTPVIVSALTIPPLSSRLHSLLQDSRILAVCSTLQSVNALNEQSFRQALMGIQPPLAASIIQFLGQRHWGEIEPAIAQVTVAAGGGARSLKEEEIESLRFAASNGAPPVPAPQLGAPPLFEVRLSDVQTFAGPAGRLTFRVVPVSRLRMVLVQTGYRRLEPVTGAVVPVSFQTAGRSWFPGVELFGEGVFLDLHDTDLGLTGERNEAWVSSFRQTAVGDDTLHPVHVWWHSLSHRLLRALSVDSGYSSAAIRERVYLHREPGGVVRGGLLLYTVQPGGDGTLGGLVGLVPSFGGIISNSLRDIASCSNDPLCEETVPDGVNGSSCYSCLLASETSCELRNIHLDRGLLLQNLP
jgi:uncharacterized protein DUF1998